MSWSLILLFYDDIHPHFAEILRCRFLFDRFKTSRIQPLAWKRQTHFVTSHHLQADFFSNSSSFWGWLLGKSQLAKQRPDTHCFFQHIFLQHSWWCVKNNVGNMHVPNTICGSVWAAGRVGDHHRSDQWTGWLVFLPCCCQLSVFKENITVGKNTGKVPLRDEVGLFFVYLSLLIVTFKVLDCFWKQNRQFEYLTLSYGWNF